ncbi:transposase [Caproiciproducens sp. R1]|uniref:transposase n=1 Tax=Caproiciproducens sp. R1 TaxID=3435000 RepID=UPI004033CB85
MPKGIPNKRHTGEFKQQVVEYMREHKLSCVETAKIFDTDHKNVALWERIYLTYGAEGLYLERRGRGGKGKLSKAPKQVEEDLIAENQRLRAENDYLKNLHALVSKRVRRENGHE